jgi:hypothetical protein
VLGWKGLKVRYSIDKHRRLIVTTAEGWLMFDDIKGHQDRLLVDPDFDASFDQLIDMTGVTTLDISAQEARFLAERRIFSPESRRVFVATKPHIFGLGRMMQIYYERLGAGQVFSSMDEALKWLGADTETPTAFVG